MLRVVGWVGDVGGSGLTWGCTPPANEEALLKEARSVYATGDGCA